MTLAADGLATLRAVPLKGTHCLGDALNNAFRGSLRLKSTMRIILRVSLQSRLTSLGPPAIGALSHPFLLREGEPPTKIDYSKKLVPLF